MSYLDWTVVGLYFLGLVIIVKWSLKQQKTTSDYFLAGRHASWLVVGASLFASNIGSEHIVGLAGNGASSGMAMAPSPPNEINWAEKSLLLTCVFSSAIPSSSYYFLNPFKFCTVARQ